MIRDLKFQLICRRHADEIYRYARGLMANAADAEDVAQEVLLRLWKNIADVTLRQSRAWLYRTTRNHCLDELRRRSHAAAPLLLGEEILNAGEDSAARDGSKSADREFLREQIDAALLKLSDVQRSVFVLYEINGLRYREIADHLEIPLNSVKVHLLRARKRLKQLLAKHESWMNA